jgi:hypothetical protein
VTLTIDPVPANSACSLVASTVHFDHAGTCVVDANQSGDSTHLAAPQVQQTIEVAKVVTGLDMQSSLTPTVYGQAAHATATVSADSGTPGGTVQFAVDGHSLGVPVAVVGGQAQSIDLTDENGHPLAPAAHPVTATFTPTDTNRYASADGSTTQVVAQADTKLVLTVQPTTVTATVTAVSPGAGTPSGLVAFAVSGTPVGTAQLSGGVATLNYTVPVGTTQNVSATYAGDTSFTGTSGSTARHDPTIVAHLTSAQAKTRFGWYRSAVKVTFTCTTDGAGLVTPCPGAVNLTHAGAAQSVTRTITATDGGSATAAVHGINIDLTKPAVVVTGVRNGGVYRGWAPRARCIATDQLSGVASCVLTQTVKNETVTYKATATDKAGNVSTATGSYRVLAYFLDSAPFDGTTYSVKVGHTYTLVVLSADRPALYAAVPYPGTPTKLVGSLHAAGHNLWAIGVTITPAMKSPQQWNLGVKFATTMHLVRIKVSP